MTALSHASPAAWRPPTLLWASVGLHVVALAALAFGFVSWPWVLAVLVLNHLVITLSGLWPRSRWLGENITRLPAQAVSRGDWALTIDDGPDPDVTPQVLDLLAAHGARATFFCIASKAREQRALVRRIVDEGHSVQNHSDAHAHSFSLWGGKRMAADLHEAQTTLTELTGRAPRYFRAPAGLRNLFLDPVMHRLGLRLVSWTRRGYDTHERDPERVLKRLLPALDRGAILLLHDGHAARDARGKPVILSVLPLLLAAARDRGLKAVTLPQALDPMDLVDVNPASVA